MSTYSCPDVFLSSFDCLFIVQEVVVTDMFEFFPDNVIGTKKKNLKTPLDIAKKKKLWLLNPWNSNRVQKNLKIPLEIGQQKTLIIQPLKETYCAKTKLNKTLKIGETKLWSPNQPLVSALSFHQGLSLKRI